MNLQRSEIPEKIKKFLETMDNLSQLTKHDIILLIILLHDHDLKNVYNEFIKITSSFWYNDNKRVYFYYHCSETSDDQNDHVYLDLQANKLNIPKISKYINKHLDRILQINFSTVDFGDTILSHYDIVDT